MGKETAKERHERRIIDYLANWENPFCTRTDLAEKVCHINKETLYNHFKKVELDRIIAEGLNLRKDRSSQPRGQVYDSILKNALDGNPVSQREFLDRTEGKVKDVTELSGPGGGAIEIVSAIPEPEEK